LNLLRLVRKYGSRPPQRGHTGAPLVSGQRILQNSLKAPSSPMAKTSLSEYKQARETVMLGGSDPKPFLKISHLNIADEHYHEREDGRALEGYEIVQSGSDDLERRARLSDWVARTALAVRYEIDGRN
jgi:hypothetical protein